MAKRKCPFRETKCSLSVLGYYYNNWNIQPYNDNDYGIVLYYSEKTSSSGVLYTFGLLLDDCYHEQACCDLHSSGRCPFHAIRLTSQTPSFQWPKQCVIRQWGQRIVNTSWSCSNTFFNNQTFSPHFVLFLEQMRNEVQRIKTTMEIYFPGNFPVILTCLWTVQFHWKINPV